jgi:hypothetical protein
MRSLALLFLLTSSCATAGDVPKNLNSWCFEEVARTQSGWELLSNLEVAPVRSPLRGNAKTALLRRSVIELTPEKASMLAEVNLSGSGSRYYLSRAGVYAPKGADVKELHNAISQARYEGYWLRDKNELILSTFHSPQLASKEFSVPVILRTSVPISRVYVSCYAVR